MTAMSRYWGVFSILIAIAVVGAPGGMAAAQQRVGVSTAVNPEASGTAPGGATRKLVIGQEVVHDEHIATGPAGQSQILFIDESALTVAPNSDMTIDDFVFDPGTGKGRLAMSVTEGVLRFVGGKISKNENAVTLQTPTASLSIRGGIFVMNLSKSGSLQVVLLYGQGLSVAGNCAITTQCPTQTITRPGFAVSVSAPGATPSEPAPAPPGAVAAMLGQFNGQAGATAGSKTPPTDTTVANSGIANTVSGNVAASVQQAAQNTPVTTQPATSTQTTTGATLTPASVQTNLNTVSAQANPATVAFQQNPTPPGTPIPSSNPTPAPTPPAPQPVVIQISGAVKDTNGAATPAGFMDQTSAGRFTLTGTITYPPGAVLQNGVLLGTADCPGCGSGTLSPLTPGSTNTVTFQGQNQAGDTASGTATMSADGNFFYADLLSTNPNSPGERAFIFGGVPVSQSFYAPTSTQQFYAFNVKPDAALGSNTSGQTIPFLPSNFGGTMPNASVSPLLVATSANEQFGISNILSHNDGLGPKWLQASLAVNGLAGNQTSALVVASGGFSTSSDNGQVIVAGLLRGTVMQGATSPAVEIGASVHSVPDGSGNSLFGGSTIDGFVLDQNDNNITANFVPNLADAAQFGQTTANYAFNQPVTAAPAFTPGTRSALNETGFFGGILTHTTNPTSGSPYALTGTTFVQTDPASNRVAATFSGTDPFTSGQSGISSMVLQFGSLPSASISPYGRSVYIDNNNYAAMESPVTPSQINGTNLPTFTTAANPTVNAPGSAPVGSGLTNLTPSLTMVTSATVGNSWMPAGVTPCACQYLQWGYWTGQVLTPNAGLTAATRADRAFVSTWVAGMPTVNMPASGSGNFNGAAVGTVFSNGATYLAAGNFSQTYDFGAQTGAVHINNFDNANYTFTVNGAGQVFAGGLTTGPANRTGAVLGGFFGPGAVESGGSFNIQSTAGLRYIASGIFAGR